MYKKIIFNLVLLGIYMIPQAQLSLEQIWYSKEFSPKYVAGFQYMANGKSYCKLEIDSLKHQECNRYDIKTGKKTETIFSTKNILFNDKPIAIQSFSFNNAEDLVLISNGFEQVYRHSGKSNTYLYQLKSNTLVPISDKKIMYATLSPDGSKVAYVSDNNLYYYDIKTRKDIAITNDGKKNFIINGAVDWVYEEEFAMSIGFEWSFDSKFIAYYKFDESKVPEFSMELYNGLYPEVETWKYPKAGEPNSKVDVYIYEAAKNKNVMCETGSQNDQYLPRIHWVANKNVLSIQRLNRLQNKLEVLLANPLDGSTYVFFKEENKYYIEVQQLHIEQYDKDTKEAYKMYYLSEKKGYNQLWFYASDKGKILEDKLVINSSFDIDNFLGVNNNIAYYTSGKNTPEQRQLYAFDINKQSEKQLTQKTGWHSIAMAENFKYYVDNYSTITQAPHIELFTIEGKSVRILEDNKALNEKLSKLNFGETIFGNFYSENNIKLDYWQLLPPNFDSSRKYPVLFYVYGGPGYQTVKNAWQGANYLWYRYMANKGYIVISIDNRGSGGRGEEFKKCTYLQLGKYETEDYISAAKYFGNKNYADKNRIGIFGWSYGGFMASNCITKGANYFSTAIAVAPVTNWRYYDNIYTERYMRTPQENADGYDKNSPINHVDSIKGNYLIIHGTADDNVHFQNAAEMVKAMNDKNIPYDAEYYPNKNHAILGGKTRLHLFTKISKFIEKNL